MTICPKFLYSGPDVPWMNPQCLGINTLPPRSNLYTYPSEKKALNADPLDSPWHLLLEGNWNFKLYKKPSDLENSVIIIFFKSFLCLYYFTVNYFLVDIDVPAEALQSYISAFLPVDFL